MKEVGVDGRKDYASSMVGCVLHGSAGLPGNPEAGVTDRRYQSKVMSTQIR